MRSLRSTDLKRQDGGRSRRGSLTLYFLLFMALTVSTMFVAINLWRIAEAKAQQQRFCDAVAHAAACELTRETTVSPIYSLLLHGDPSDIQNLCQTFCIDEAKKFAARNFVDGVALDLDTSTVNKDVKFGKFDFNAESPAFAAIDPTTATTDEVRAINAVRIETFRTAERKNAIRLFGPSWIGYASSQIVARTTAALDRRVIGFRIQNNMADPPAALSYQAIPMVPLALLNDATATSWKQMVEAPADPTMSPIPFGTMTVHVPTSSVGMPTKNSRLLDIGIATIAQLNEQIISGITPTQMASYNPATKAMILSSATNAVNVPEFPAPALDAAMLANFQTLMANKTERVWPLYEIVSGSDVVVTGFVAARVTAVATPDDTDGNSYISLTLQPTFLETPTAFTDYSNRFLKTTANSAITDSGPPSPYASYARLVNPYICRVRLVD